MWVTMFEEKLDVWTCGSCQCTHRATCRLTRCVKCGAARECETIAQMIAQHRVSQLVHQLCAECDYERIANPREGARSTGLRLLEGAQERKCATCLRDAMLILATALRDSGDDCIRCDGCQRLRMRSRFEQCEIQKSVDYCTGRYCKERRYCMLCVRNSILKHFAKPNSDGLVAAVATRD